MHMFNLSVSLFKKFITLLICVSILSMVSVFDVEENIKNEINTLCKATSISDYYNTITNFSYSLISTLLESTKIVIDNTKQNQNDNKNNKTDEKNKTSFIFVQSSNKNLKSSQFAKNISFNNVILIPGTFKNYLFQKYIFYIHTVVLIFMLLIFCYFARGNIEENKNINMNMGIINHLV